LQLLVWKQESLTSVQRVEMATGTRVQNRKGGTAHRLEDAATGDGTVTVPAGAKLDKSGLYDQQQVKRLLDDQLVAVRIRITRDPRHACIPKFWDRSDGFLFPLGCRITSPPYFRFSY
jgi:hypothetical protein